jgi:hypothetical protein
MRIWFRCPESVPMAMALGQIEGALLFGVIYLVYHFL